MHVILIRRVKIAIISASCPGKLRKTPTAPISSAGRCTMRPKPLLPVPLALLAAVPLTLAAAVPLTLAAAVWVS